MDGARGYMRIFIDTNAMAIRVPQIGLALPLEGGRVGRAGAKRHVRYTRQSLGLQCDVID